MRIFLLFLLMFSFIPTALAHDEPHPPIEVGESIVNLELSCGDLDEDQIIAVGTYLYGDSRFVWWLKLRTYVGYCWGKNNG